MKEKEYVELVPKVYEDCLSEFEEVQDKRLLWDLVKYKLRQASIDFGKTKAQSRRQKEEYISEQLKDLEQKLAENKDLERNTEKYEHLKGDLEKLYEHKIQGVMLRWLPPVLHFLEPLNFTKGFLAHHDGLLQVLARWCYKSF